MVLIGPSTQLFWILKTFADPCFHVKSFVFIPKSLNGAAHLLAKLSYSLNRDFLWDRD